MLLLALLRQEAFVVAEPGIEVGIGLEDPLPFRGQVPVVMGLLPYVIYLGIDGGADGIARTMSADMTDIERFIPARSGFSRMASFAHSP